MSISIENRDRGILWDEWRRDPEDPSGWHATGRGGVYGDEAAAQQAAIAAIEWLTS